MGPLYSWFVFLTQWSARFWPLFFDHLWQSTLFVLLALAASVFLRRAPARARYGIWLMALLKFLVPSALLVQMVPATSLRLPGVFDSFLWPSTDPAATTLSQPSRIFLLLTVAWLAGAAAILLRWLLRYRSVARIVASDPQVEAGRDLSIFKRAVAMLKLTGPVTLKHSDTISEPVVWGVKEPVVVLPREMSLHFSDEELLAVMLHELSHVKRRDNFFGNLTMVLCCAVWFHPLVWWLDRRLLVEREKACDDRVVGLLDGAKAYAAGLLKVVRFRLSGGLSRSRGGNLAGSLAGMARAGDSHLGPRIKRILAGSALRPLGVAHRVVLAGFVLAFLMLSSSAHSSFGAAFDLGGLSSWMTGKCPGSPSNRSRQLLLSAPSVPKCNRMSAPVDAKVLEM